MNAQTKLCVAAGWNTSVEDVELTGNVILNYKNAYASINLVTDAFNVEDYPSYELVLADDAPIDKLQFNIGYNDDKDGYSGPLASTTPGYFIPEGATTIHKIALQACNVENLGRIEIKSFCLIDKDGNKVATKYEMPPSWAADVLTIFEATMNFTVGGQWNNGALKGAEGLLLPATITVNADELPSDVQLNISTPAQVPDWQNVVGDRHIYNAWTAGAKTYSVDIEPVEEGETIQSIEVQNTVERDPFKITHLSATVSQYRKIEVGDAGFATFSPKLPVDLSAVTAYKAKYEDGFVKLTPVTEAPAGVGIIIEAAKNSYKAPVIESAAALTGNELLVSDGTVEGDEIIIEYFD